MTRKCRASSRAQEESEGARRPSRRRSRPGIRTNALENRDSIHRMNIAGPPAGENREQNGDESAHDVGIAVAREGEHGSARTIRMHAGCEPNLAGAALDLVRFGTLPLRERAQAAAEFDDIAVTVVPLLEQRKVVEDLVERCERLG